MIVGFSRYGRGKADPAIDYLMASVDSQGGARLPSPEVLRGDPEMVRRLVNGTPHLWKYRSGVLSFAEEISPELEATIIDEFEGLAFAGLDRDRVSVLWVRHAHTGRTELHFLMPRMDLSTGRSLNIAPPGYQKDFDLLRSRINLEHGLADPDDPRRWKRSKAADHLIKLAKLKGGKLKKAELIDSLETYLEQCHVKSRDEVVEKLRDAGFDIPRAGRDYVTVHHPELGRHRLRGSFFRENGFEPRPTTDGRHRLAAIREQLDKRIALRAAYHRDRFGSVARHTLSFPTHNHDTTREHAAGIPSLDRLGIPEARSGARIAAEELDRQAQRYGRALGRLDAAARWVGRAIAGLKPLNHWVRSLLEKYSITPPVTVLHDGDHEFERERGRNHD